MTFPWRTLTAVADRTSRRCLDHASSGGREQGRSLILQPAPYPWGWIVGRREFTRSAEEASVGRPHSHGIGRGRDTAPDGDATTRRRRREYLNRVQIRGYPPHRDPASGVSYVDGARRPLSGHPPREREATSLSPSDIDSLEGKDQRQSFRTHAPIADGLVDEPEMEGAFGRGAGFFFVWPLRITTHPAGLRWHREQLSELAAVIELVGLHGSREVVLCSVARRPAGGATPPAPLRGRKVGRSSWGLFAPARAAGYIPSPSHRVALASDRIWRSCRFSR
jgi:hypothetical protein